MTAHWTVRRHWLQNANESCDSCASLASLAGLVLSFIACFMLLVIPPSVRSFITLVVISRKVEAQDGCLSEVCTL